jgi:hypothetical protein
MQAPGGLVDVVSTDSTRLASFGAQILMQIVNCKHLDFPQATPVREALLARLKVVCRLLQPKQPATLETWL